MTILSAVAGCTKSGLELCGLAVISKLNTAFQTIYLKKNEKLLDFYTHKLGAKHKKLLEISKYIVADAFLSNLNFVKSLSDVGFYISRIQYDADLCSFIFFF